MYLDILFMDRRLVIDVLAFEYGKSFGYQEYMFNLLDYIYVHRTDILYHEIVIVCIESQRQYFEKYASCFQIKSYACRSVFHRLLAQTLMPFNLSLRSIDLVLYTANYSSLIKRASNILVIHDLLFKRKSFFPYKLMRYQRTFYLPFSIRYADKIVAISQFTANDVKKYYSSGKEKIVTIYNYFNFEKYALANKVYNKEDWFISVCSNAVHKNSITVLKAFDLYCMNGGTYGLILVGALKEGSSTYLYYDSLSADVKKRIKIYDKISNTLLAELYQKSKAYISASLFEGLGMPVVEAMYFDLPVILSDLPVFHEVSFEKGIYFDPLNEKDLSDKMFYVQSNSFHDSYKKQVMNLYSEQNTSHKYIELFNMLYNKTK